MRNKFTLYKNIALVVGSSLAFIFAFVGFVQSYSYDDSWGIEIKFDKDYLALMLTCVVLIIYSVYVLYMDIKAKTKNPLANLTSIGLISAITFCYPLGVFFKELAKALSKGNDFAYTDYQWYLYLSIIGLAFLVYAIISYIEYRKNK